MVILFSVVLLFFHHGRIVTMGGTMFGRHRRGGTTIVPRNGKLGHPRLVGQNLSLHAIQRQRRRRGAIPFHVVTHQFVIHVITDATKFALLVTARDQHDRDAQNFGQIVHGRCVGLQTKLVDTDGDRADQNFVQHLILGGVVRRTDVQDLPFEVVLQFLQAFKGDFELKGVLEIARIVENDHVHNVDERHDSTQEWLWIFCCCCCWAWKLNSTTQPKTTVVVAGLFVFDLRDTMIRSSRWGFLDNR
mmetsp:Transcript_4263/g.11626  ORF Transcript_4263/g.11626 Transcript_4263/m.11626 type:complete len:246 (-) Transcript_4263:167-904(-)